MILKTQIILLIASFVYGVIFSLIVNISYRLIYNKKKLVKITFSLVLSIIFSSVYFYLLLKINNGIIHHYSLISFILGYLLIDIINKK